MELSAGCVTSSLRVGCCWLVVLCAVVFMGVPVQSSTIPGQGCGDSSTSPCDATAAPAPPTSADVDNALTAHSNNEGPSRSELIVTSIPVVSGDPVSTATRVSDPAAAGGQPTSVNPITQPPTYPTPPSIPPADLMSAAYVDAEEHLKPALSASQPVLPGVLFQLSPSINASDPAVTPPSSSRSLINLLNSTTASDLTTPTAVPSVVSGSSEMSMMSTDSMISPGMDAATAVGSTTPYVDFLSFHMGANSKPSTVPTIPVNGTTVPSDPGTSQEGQGGLWGTVPDHVLDPSNHTAPPFVPPSNGSVDDPFPIGGADPTSSLALTTPPVTRENVTDRHLLPDDSKKNEVVAPLDGTQSETSVSSSNTSMPGVGVEPSRLPTDAPAATAPGSQPGSGNEVDGGGSGGPAEAPDSPWWPSADDDKKKSGPVQTGAGDSSPDVLDKFQIAFLVAPGVGALLAVMGVCCVIRCATAAYRKRRKLRKKIKKQRKKAEKKMKQEEKKKEQEEKRREKEEEKRRRKKDSKAELMEEDETKDHRHKRHKKHHRHHDHHHHTNGDAIQHADDHKGVKKSSKH